MTDRYYIAIGIAISMISDEVTSGIMTENRSAGIMIKFVYQNKDETLFIYRDGECVIGARKVQRHEHIEKLLKRFFR